MSFDTELSKGNFFIPECVECKKIVWPPADFCNACFGQTSLRHGKLEGKIMEFSSKNEEYFCIVEIEKAIQIMAKKTEMPKIGQTVRIVKCGIKDGDYFFEIS